MLIRMRPIRVEKRAKSCLTEKIAFVACLLLLVLGCRIGVRDEALELAKAIPQYPSSTYLGSFQTSYPDDVPGSGVNYLSDDTPGDILDFFLREVPQQGWVVVKVYDYADEAVPKQLLLERPKWKCRILVINEELRRISIKVERR
jgi:hypothetical protein